VTTGHKDGTDLVPAWPARGARSACARVHV